MRKPKEEKLQRKDSLDIATLTYQSPKLIHTNKNEALNLNNKQSPSIQGLH